MTATSAGSAAAVAGRRGRRRRLRSRPPSTAMRQERRRRALRAAAPCANMVANIRSPRLVTALMTIGSVLIPRFSLLAAVGGRREMLTEPIALAPEPGREQAVGEASGAAEAFGIRAGMPVSEALGRCPRLGPPAARPGAPASEWERILRKLEGIGAEVESNRAGEAFFAVDGLRGIWGPRREDVLARGGQGGRDAGPDRRRPDPLLRPRRGDDGARGRGRRAIRVVAAGGERDFLAPLPIDLLDRALRDRRRPRRRPGGAARRDPGAARGRDARRPRRPAADRDRRPLRRARPAGARARLRASTPRCGRGHPTRTSSRRSACPRPPTEPSSSGRSTSSSSACSATRAAEGTGDPLAQPRGAAGRRRQLERHGGDAQRQQLAGAAAAGARAEARRCSPPPRPPSRCGRSRWLRPGGAQATLGDDPGRAAARAAGRGGPAGPGGGGPGRGAARPRRRPGLAGPRALGRARPLQRPGGS